MTYTEVKKELQATAKDASFCTAAQVAKFLGLKNTYRVKESYLDGLDKVGKLYFIPDVARRISERRTG